jgi:hypothetical protein
MGKPLKAKQLNLSRGQRDRVLKWQGVKINKRIRLGHSGHFGKVDVIPIEGKVRNIGKEADSDKVRKDDQSHSPKKLIEKSPDESFSKFMKRVGKETHETLIQISSKKQKVSSKRKAYLDTRKDNAKCKKLQSERSKIVHRLLLEENRAGLKHDEEEPLSFEAVKKSISSSEPPVRFGEQAERPPQIKISKPLKGLHKLSSFNGCVPGGIPAIPELAGHEKSKREFEMLRRNAVQSYRDLTKHRRERKGLLTL